MVLRRLEGDGVQKTVQRLEDGMDSPGFEYRQAKKKDFSHLQSVQTGSHSVCSVVLSRG